MDYFPSQYKADKIFIVLSVDNYNIKIRLMHQFRAESKIPDRLVVEGLDWA